MNHVSASGDWRAVLICLGLMLAALFVPFVIEVLARFVSQLITDEENNDDI